MDSFAVDCTPENILEEMGLVQKGGIYPLKAMCSQKRNPRDSKERKSKKRKLVEEILKEKQDKQRRHSSQPSTNPYERRSTREQISFKNNTTLLIFKNMFRLS